MKLNSKGIRRDGHKKTCDCDEIIDFLVLRNKENQANACVLDAVVVLVDLDYLCHLKKHDVDGPALAWSMCHCYS